MFHRAIILFSLYLVSHQGSAFEGSLTIYTEQFPPYNFIESEKVTGINVEIVTRACELANITCKFTLYPWKRAMMMTSNDPQSGIMSTAKTKERKNQYTWIGPLVSGQSCIYRLTKRSDIKINNIVEALAYKLGDSRDTAYASDIKHLGFIEHKNLNLYPGKYGQMRPFAAGRVALIFGSANAIASQMAFVGLTPDDVVPVAKVPLDPSKGNYLALNLAVSTSIAERLQLAIDKMTQKNEYPHIRNKFVDHSNKTIPAGIEPDLWHTCL